MEQILAELKQRYDPLSILVYGSFADGTNGPGSDFDACVLTRDHDQTHDVSFVGGTQLDVFVYPADFFAGDYDRSEFIRLLGARCVFDPAGDAARLQEQIQAYVDGLPRKSHAEVLEALAWCRKMQRRTRRDDAEGLYRWHWLLTESLEIYCDAVGKPYLGPKKSLRWLQAAQPEAFTCYEAALRGLDQDALAAWLDCLAAQAAQLHP